MIRGRGRTMATGFIIPLSPSSVPLSFTPQGVQLQASCHTLGNLAAEDSFKQGQPQVERTRNAAGGDHISIFNHAFMGDLTVGAQFLAGFMMGRRPFPLQQPSFRQHHGASADRTDQMLAKEIGRAHV